MNEIELSNNLQQIEFEIQWHKENVGKSIWEIGSRLNHVKENDLTHGEFGKWLKQMEIDHTTANRFMKVSKELPSSATWHNLGNRALYLIATLPEEEREKEHTLDSGETKKVDEMTTREIEEVKQKNREQEQRIKDLEQEVKEERNKPAETITETEYKIPPEYEGYKSDYEQVSETLKQAQAQTKEAQAKNERMEEQLGDVNQSLKLANSKYELLDSSTQEARELEQKIKSMRETEQSLSGKLEAMDRLNDLEKEFETFFDKQMAPIRFKPITEHLYGTNATERITQLVETADLWVEEMRELLPKRNIKNAEIIIEGE